MYLIFRPGKDCMFFLLCPKCKTIELTEGILSTIETVNLNRTQQLAVFSIPKVLINKVDCPKLHIIWTSAELENFEWKNYVVIV